MKHAYSTNSRNGTTQMAPSVMFPADLAKI